MNEKNSIKPFSAEGEQTAISQRWDRWLRSFELFIEASAIQNDKRKRALLLHNAGEGVQEIWYTLPEADREYSSTDDVYEICKTALTAIFKPKRNYTYERHLFRSLTQKDESVIQFVTRLKTQSKNCNYRDFENEMIIDQLIEKCSSNELRRQLLKEGDKLTIDRATELGRILETSERQAGNIEAESRKTNSEQEIRKITQKKEPKTKRYDDHNKPKNNMRCYRCDRDDHWARDPKCPAREKTCENCQIKGHFAKCCKTKMGKGNQRKKIRNIEEEKDEEGSDEYAFQLRFSDDPGNIEAWVGGVKIRFIIDSGASCNVIDKDSWSTMKKNRAQGKCTTTGKRLFAYGNEQPLDTLGIFSAKIDLGDGKKLENTKFYVVNGKGVPLLGKETARELGILRMGLPLRNINMEEEKSLEDWKQDFPKLFEDKIGKLKGQQLKLVMNEEIEPVTQTARRIPYQLRKPIREKLQELIKGDIIEKVNEPSRWVSPVVCTTKKTNELRMCIDMRAANEAIVRERHPIPTVKDLIINLNGAKWFSEIDLKSAFHQIELDEKSREITTFATNEGLHRFKRLFFGINCAPEIFQRIMEQSTEGLAGVEVYIDNFLVYGKTLKEHNKNLRNLLERLQDLNMTLNPKKCKIARKTIEFMGHEISEEGIIPLKSRVDAIKESRAPENKTELQSFLGLIGFCSKFIPEYSTLTAPLRELLKKNSCYKWTEEHETSFKKLKNTLTRKKTLGFFNPEKKSTIIADASPYGLGAVLIQQHEEGYKVIEFASKALTDTEKKYSQTEKEALGLVWACERFHYYVYGTHFDLVTDHKPLQYIFAPRSKPCPRIERWVMRISGYNFRVVYQPGKQNIADPLSRLSQQQQPKTNFDKGNEHIKWVAQQATPRYMDLEQIREKYEEDSDLKELRNAIQEDRWPVKLRKYEVIKIELSVIDGIILRGTRILIPAALRGRVLKLAHEGHPGIVQMKQRLRGKVWWTGMDKEVEEYIKRCHGCQLVGAADPPEPISTTRLPETPWNTVAMDFLGPLDDGIYIFVVIDYYSRFYEAKIMRTITSSKTIMELEEIFARFGLPETIVADNGKQFTSAEFRDFCEENGINLRINTPKWPQSNGEVERQNRSIIKRLKIAQATGEDLTRSLRQYMFSYHTTPHSTTGRTPASLMLGREIRDKLPDYKEDKFRQKDFEVRDRDAEMKGKYKRYADMSRNSREKEIELGSQVLVKRDAITDKLQTPFHPTPCTIINKNGTSVTYQTPEGRKYTRNSSYVKKFKEPEGDTTEKGPDNAKEIMNEIEEQEKAPEMELRRSTRCSRPPKWLDDYADTA